ncbi:MAG: hypothetical protein HYR70_11490 [Chloroflexi bacterium]|nr:hypothetical protein [Chloroflexota bacterium]MBI3339256.1 hypothetical protein [Chloroflexota bacterium]
MKKTYILTLLLVFALAITACSGASSQNGQSPAGTGQGQGFNNRPISPQLQLATGIFKLEGTPQAVDAKEAAQLIPLWQLFGQLSTSSSSAPQEVTAVLDQIKSTMTPGQISAINAMNLTNRDAFTFMQQQGIVQSDGFGSNGTPDANRTFRGGGDQAGGGHAGGGEGGGPGGNIPGGGFNGGGQNLNPSQIATLQARRAQGGGDFNNRLPAELLNALIKLLQSKITPSTTSTATPATPASTAIPADTATIAVTPTP